MSLAGFLVFESSSTSIKFSFWNAIFHLVIDAVSWNLYGYCLMGRKYGFDNLRKGEFNFKQKASELSSQFNFLEDEWFMRTLGADQIAHMIVLYQLYDYFKDI